MRSRVSAVDGARPSHQRYLLQYLLHDNVDQVLHCSILVNVHTKDTQIPRMQGRRTVEIGGRGDKRSGTQMYVRRSANARLADVWMDW